MPVVAGLVGVGSAFVGYNGCVTIKAAQLPNELVLAFVDALEAWVAVERALFMLWQLLNRTRDIDTAWGQFTAWNAPQQRKETETVVIAAVSDASIRASIMALIEQTRDLADKRNRIVHGRWQSQNVWKGGKHVGIKYLRIYDARKEPSRPVDEIAERPMLGRTRFYAADLRRAERQFLAAARNLDWAIPNILPFI